MARYDVQRRVALITGGARGIGFATAQALRARGASVALDLIAVHAPQVQDVLREADVAGRVSRPG
jgi:3-oxoacyl-[acyl-carrier protein] reductase